MLYHEQLHTPASYFCFLTRMITLGFDVVSTNDAMTVQ